MLSLQTLANEEARLAAVACYRLDSPAPFGELEPLLRLAARLFATSTAFISIATRQGQMVKACSGPAASTPRSSFDTHVLTLPPAEMLIVPDARLDSRFAEDPLEHDAAPIVFYAGVPLRAPSGEAFGTLCIVDRVPRADLSPEERRDLAQLAAIVLDRLELRRLALGDALDGRRQNEERLYRLAHFDSLTELPNRVVLTDCIAHSIAAAEPAALLMIDLDHFKEVNDTLGHSVGDKVLRLVAQRIRSCAREIDTVARLGGDEFAVLMPDRPSPTTVAQEADCLIASLAEPYLVDDETIHVSGSVGIALFPDHGTTAAEWLAAADLAMYQAKAEGRDCRRIFTPTLRKAAASRREFEGEVRRGFERGEFALFYQPLVRLIDGQVIGVEALLRWRHPQEGLLLPDRFLSSVDAGPLAAPVGRWVIETACVDAGRLRRKWPDLIVGVNLFAAQFRTGRLAPEVEEMLARGGVPPEALELEITEKIILRHDQTMIEPLRELHARGVRIALDDFGTGFASMNVLKRYPLDRIKIDASLICAMGSNPVDAGILAATIHLGKALGVQVVAEGVERREQLDDLLARGCDVAQGDLCGKPQPIDRLLGAFEGATLGTC